VNLADYPDEFILSLKKGFLINSLIAFKHKNDGDYVKEYFSRIFANLEEIQSTELGRNFLDHLAVYIVIATTLKAKEVLELADKLPENIKKTVMTTYDNLIEFGKEQGIEQGIEQGAIKRSLQTVVRLLKINLPLDVISEGAEVSIETVKLFNVNIENKYTSKTLQKALATHILINFSILPNELIADFTKLETSEIENLRKHLNDLKEK